MKPSMPTACILLASSLFAQGASAAKPSYSDQLKTASTVGLAYEAGRQAKNAIDACGFKVADYVWASARKNKPWSAIAPEIQKISNSKECQSSSQSLSMVSEEISNRNNSFLNGVMAKLFPKTDDTAAVHPVVQDDHISRFENIESYEWNGEEPCSSGLIEKALPEFMARALYYRSDAGPGYFDKSQLINDEPIKIVKLGTQSFYDRTFQEFQVTFKTRKGEIFKVVTIDNTTGKIVGGVLLLGPVDVEKTEHGLDLQYCSANYLSRVSQYDDSKLSNPEDRNRYFSVGDKKYSMGIRSVSTGAIYGSYDADDFSNGYASVSVGNFAKIMESISNRK